MNNVVLTFQSTRLEEVRDWANGLIGKPVPLPDWDDQHVVISNVVNMWPLLTWEWEPTGSGGDVERVQSYAVIVLASVRKHVEEEQEQRDH